MLRARRLPSGPPKTSIQRGTLQSKFLSLTGSVKLPPAARIRPNTLYIGYTYTAIGYGAKLVKGWVLGCPYLPTVNLIGYNAKHRLQRGVKSVITRI